ncbi:valine--tRNA ligase [Candidatus Azambacteria bacterium]|nr:valine--tRNA ligase [Candidatus Azambacteria bacterium]
MKLNTAYNPKDVEERIYKLWEKSGCFNPDKLPGKRTKKFSVMMAPPNITGSLHLGHALENTMIDILIRMKRMQGFKTLWLPGIDHAGIAAQNVVEKSLRKEGLRRQDLGREKFTEKMWAWKEKYGHIILGQLKKIGALPDWSRTRFTLDHDYAKAVQEAFIHYHKKGWIYRGERVINWCPRCETGISDLEIEYREEKGKLYHIKYPLADKSGFITVATTRPETMLGDAAVAVNPKDGRYKHLVGKFVALPIQNRRIPVIADRGVDMDFGTGAVKVTPAHDVADFEMSLRHNLPKIKIIDEKGIMANTAGPICEGLKAIECREKVVAELQKFELLEKTEDYVHNVAFCERCSAKIEPRLSKQWFLKMAKLSESAIKTIKSKETALHPKKWEKMALNWLKNIRDWNISRQLWWGHQLPVWFCKNQTGVFNFQFSISKQKKGKNKIKDDNFIVSLEKPKECPICKNCEMEQSVDVLDTWFSSALWPFATLGWPQKTADLKTYYPTDYIASAREILNLWIIRMIFSGKEFTGKSPFKTAHIHATILTKEGKRMSKSLGTGIDPLLLIDKYGADATRFGLIYQNLGNQDIRFAEDAMITGKKFCNKIWNATRFVLLQTENFQFSIFNFKTISKLKLSKYDKKILNDFKKTKKEIEKQLEKYEFGKALRKLYDFFWHDFCDVYIEKSKQQSANPKLAKNTAQILFYILTNSIKMLHPFLPFITEEIWGGLKSEGLQTDALIIESWPK